MLGFKEQLPHCNSKGICQFTCPALLFTDTTPPETGPRPYPTLHLCVQGNNFLSGNSY